MPKNEKRELIDVAHVSAKGTSYRITVPRKIVAILGLKDEDIVAFYREDGKIVLESLK